MPPTTPAAKRAAVTCDRAPLIRSAVRFSDVVDLAARWRKSAASKTSFNAAAAMRARHSAGP